MKFKRNKRSLSTAYPPVTSVIYKGPLFPNSLMEGGHLYTFSLAVSGVASSDGSGNISGLSETLQVTTTTDFASYQAIFSEYRVLGLRVEYEPYVSYPSTNYGTGVCISTHDSSLATPTLLTPLLNVPNRKTINFGKRWVMEWRMSGVDEATFTPTATAVDHGGIAWFAEGGPISTALGRYITTMLVQFRGQK